MRKKEMGGKGKGKGGEGERDGRKSLRGKGGEGKKGRENLGGVGPNVFPRTAPAYLRQKRK